MLPVFDGHNDALTQADHGDLVTGRRGGHLDLPRMRAGGMRGGIFAIFTPSPGDQKVKRAFGQGGTYAEPLAAPIGRPEAAADATAAELGDAAGLPKLLAALEAIGFSPEEVAAICWHNWRRVLDSCWR